MKLKVRITEMKTTGNTTIVVYQVKKDGETICKQRYIPSDTTLSELVKIFEKEDIGE